jgi:hypothetical protein
MNEALVQLARGNPQPFIIACKTNPGFPRGPAAIGVLNTLSEEDYEQLRAQLKAETKVRVLDLDRALKAAKLKPNGDHQKASGSPDKPTIILRLGETRRAVNELEAALRAAGGLYARGGLIVSTASAKLPTWDGKTVIAQVIEERGDYALREDAEAAANFVKLDEAGNQTQITPPLALIKTLKDRKHRLRFPVLVGIVNCPSISAVDGTLLDEPGFDATTGILFDPQGVRFPPVPKNPTRLDATVALGRLNKLIAKYDFETEDDKAVALSLFLTVIGRRGLPNVPMHALDAPVAGVGKSKLVDVASVMATGHEAGVIAWVKNPEESEKRLSAALMRGDPLIALDNCEAPLEGELINQVLTQTRLELRILGYSKLITTSCSATLCATGNNLVVKGDLTRRGVIGRLSTDTPRPELREFDFDPVAVAKHNRGELVVAALTILRAYYVAGRPNRPKPALGSFGHWSDNVRGALIWLGCGDPVGTQDRLREKDPALVSMITVLTAWLERYGSTPRTANFAAHEANQRTRAFEEGHFVEKFVNPDFRDALAQVALRGRDIDVRVLGIWLSKNMERPVELDGKRLVVLKQAGKLHGNQQWQVIGRAS